MLILFYHLPWKCQGNKTEKCLTNDYFSIIISIMEQLRKKELRHLYDKVTVYARKKLFILLTLEGWQGTEIAKQFGLPSNRQSEIKDPVKYPNVRLSPPLLEKLIGGGFVTIKEIFSSLELNDKERRHIKDLLI